MTVKPANIMSADRPKARQWVGSRTTDHRLCHMGLFD